MGSFFFRSLTFRVPPPDRKQSNVEDKQSTAGLITIALQLITLVCLGSVMRSGEDGFPRRGSQGGQTGKEENATGQFLRMELPEMYPTCRPGTSARTPPPPQGIRHYTTTS